MKQITKIIWNSIIAGALVFFGSATTLFTNYGFDNPQAVLSGLLVGLCSSIVVFLTKIGGYLSQGTIPLSSNKGGSFPLFDFI